MTSKEIKKIIDESISNLDESIKWQTDNLDRQLSFLAIPLEPGFMENLFGLKTIKAYHVSDVEGMLDLKSIENSRRSVSASTYVGDNMLFNYVSGISRPGGFVAEIEGQVLVNAPDDVMSIPDRNGRRWITSILAVISNSDNVKINNWSTFMRPKLKTILNKALLKSGKFDKRDLDFSILNKKISTDNDKELYASYIYYILQDLENKDKEKIYSYYIKEVYSLLKKSASRFKNAFLMQKSRTGDWNEVVVAKFKINKIYVFADVLNLITDELDFNNLNEIIKLLGRKIKSDIISSSVDEFKGIMSNNRKELKLESLNTIFNGSFLNLFTN